ncbi:IS481 family transposase [Microlunatus elymi]|uniref:IS481 family transposase n=1 Tax=Microlunatus elymi TaxID=2596828 RepID=UPI001AEFD285|nr:IS481 family transposase [Microlunatus elymi]
MALIVLSVVEQRLDAVRAALGGGDVGEIALSVGVHRSTLHRWMARYLIEGVAGLSDRSHRPESCPHQVATSVEVLVAEMRRKHPRWGAKRIRMEMLRRPAEGLTVPSVRTIVRILHRQGLSQPRPRKRPRESYVRFQREGPMQMWGIDIVGGIDLVDTRTGEIRGAKIVTGVDDHSRFCVMAKVVERATSRQVCLALAEALARFGVPEEIITDNGKQFTDRFGRHGARNGEVLFDKICRNNGITHRLTQPASPNQNGKVERFHGTFRPDFLDQAEPFESLILAQAAVDAWVEHYNTDRPHQALDDQLPVTPVQRFRPVPEADRALIDVWLPPALKPTESVTDNESPPAQESFTDKESLVDAGPDSPEESWAGGPVELDRVVPASGNMLLCGKQFWLGPARSGQVVRFWASVDMIHVLIGGARVKTVRSHLTVKDLARLVAAGAVNAGPSPLPPIEDGAAVEVDRSIASGGITSLGGKTILAAEILAGRRVGIRIEPDTLQFFDLQSRELLRTRPNPLTPEQVARLRGLRPAGPPPRPSVEPIRVQRRASKDGTISICSQRVSLGRIHRYATVTIYVSETTLRSSWTTVEPESSGAPPERR